MRATVLVLDARPSSLRRRGRGHAVGAGIGRRRGATESLRSDSRSLRPRRRLVYYRALKVDRAQARRLCQPAGDGAGRQAVARGAAGVLAERLQRAGAAHGRRSLPDPGTSADYPAEEHPPDFRRLRAAAAPVARPHPHARSDRADGPARVSTIRACYLALGRGAMGSGRLRSEAFDARRAREAARPKRRPSASAARSASRSIARATRLTSARSSRGARRSSRPPTPTRRRRRSPAAARSSARLAFVEPKLLTTEKEFLAKNTFKVAYIPFDWTLNDLTGRGGR